MKFRSLMTAICVLATANIVSAAPFAYVANSGTKNVSVIDTATNTVTATVALPDDNGATLPNPYAYGVAVGASGQYVYVGLQDTNEVAVIDAATKTVVKRIGLGSDSPGGLAVNTAETRLYVTSNKSNTLIVIDITGSAASEVGRISVEDAAQSNPEGVVLNPAGTKAYVANSTKGTIAEVSIDEVGNVYTRTNLIPLVSNTQPMGLAINSTGTKLYAASANGTASVINTSTMGVTDLPVAIGYSVSVSTDNSKVYFPSSSLDKIYVADGSADTVSATTYSVPGAPWGSSIAPNGMLYMAMYSSGPDYSVKVFDPASNTVTSTIALPPGAKPISMGDFIGPLFDATITSAAQANCSITPLGAVPVVKGFNRLFNVTASSNQCEIFTGCNTSDFTGGTSQGITGSYLFTNIQADNTICAINKTGTYYTLSGDWISSVGGCLQSSPAGVTCASKGQSAEQSAKFLAGTVVTLAVNDSNAYRVQPGTWAGACAGSSTTCTITMDANKSFGTSTVVELKPVGGTGPVFNLTKSSYHQTCAEAFAAATTGDQIKISTDITSCTTSGTNGVMTKVSTQWKSSDYSTQDTYKAIVPFTITNVGVTVDPTTGYVLKL